jgi:hypothetical protein
MSASNWILISSLFLHFLQFVQVKPRVLVFLRLSKQHKKEMDCPQRMKTLWKDCEYSPDRFRIRLPPWLPKYVTKILITTVLSERERNVIRHWDYTNIHSFHDFYNSNEWTNFNASLLQTASVVENTLKSCSTAVMNQFKTVTVRHSSTVHDFSQFNSLTFLALSNANLIHITKLLLPEELRILKLQTPEILFINNNTKPFHQIREFSWHTFQHLTYKVCRWSLVLEQMPNLEVIHLFCTCFERESEMSRKLIPNELMEWLSKDSKNRLHFEHCVNCHEEAESGWGQEIERSKCSLGALFAGVEFMNAEEANWFHKFQTIWWTKEQVDQIRRWYNETTFCQKTIQFLSHVAREQDAMMAEIKARHNQRR